MTKKDIVLKITDATGIKQVDVKKIVQRTLDVIVESLERGETVELRNFGVFKVKNRRSYAAICMDNLCEGSTPKQAIRRLYHPLRRMGYELIL